MRCTIFKAKTRRNERLLTAYFKHKGTKHPPPPKAMADKGSAKEDQH
jgi:hypothetical protein